MVKDGTFHKNGRYGRGSEIVFEESAMAQPGMQDTDRCQ